MVPSWQIRKSSVFSRISETQTTPGGLSTRIDQPPNGRLTAGIIPVKLQPVLMEMPMKRTAARPSRKQNECLWGNRGRADRPVLVVQLGGLHPRRAEGRGSHGERFPPMDRFAGPGVAIRFQTVAEVI